MDEKNKVTLWEFFQGLGKTFMLPVSLLAFMGLMLGLGSAFTSPSTIELLPFLDNQILQIIFRFLSSMGGFAFTYLPLMFALAIPMGLARNEKGIAGFSGLVGYIIMNLSINFFLSESNQLVKPEAMKEAGQSMVLGIQTIEMGVLGGIIVGVIVYLLHSKFYKTQLPDSFAFFSGARFVPIVTSVCLSIVGLIIPMIWPAFAWVITGIGTAIHKSGPFGPFLFGTGERLLLPFGLHHILVSMIRFTEAGGTEVVNGTSVSGALNIFYAQLQQGLPISHLATSFLSQGKMPTFMFGLPAAALAMYRSAYVQNRKAVKGLLISGVVATFVTGITEPLEFLFLFVSPLLYGFHAIMTGLGFMVMSLLGVSIGNTDGGVLDFIIFGVLQGSATKWYLVPIVGAVWFAIYYYVFSYFIKKKDLKTPGRSETENKSNGEFDVTNILMGIGGKENLVNLDNCITRLRLTLNDTAMVDEKLLKDSGAIGVVILDKNNVQVIIGTKATSVRNELEQLI